MTKRIGYGMAVLTMLLIVALAYNPASAKTYALGVKIGDTADYTLSSDGPFFVNVTGMHLYVFGVTGTTKVTLNVTLTFKNGSHSKPISGATDITDGSSMLFLLARNLTTGDPIYPSALWKINDTPTMTVAGASRTVVHLNATFIFLVGGNIYWDQQTGIIVKSNWHQMTGWLTWAWYNVSLTGTSLWSAGLFGLSWTTLAIIAGAAIVLIAVIAVVLRRRK